VGVGVLYNGTLDSVLEKHGEAADFVSVIPERFWNDLGRRSRPRFVPLPDEVATLDGLAARFPLVAHGIGLSIASASTFDVEHVEQLARWHRHYNFRWISEHLAAVRVRKEETSDHHAGLVLPLPWDEDALALISERVVRTQDILGCQLLLENAVVHTPVPESDMSETEFVNALCHRTGCGLLLDLHNLYVNARNLHFDAEAYLDRLDLGAVKEIHVAGGNELYGVYLDSHAGPCPPEVWRLLDGVVTRCPALRGVTFEYHESYFPGLGDEGVLAQLARARAALARREQHVAV
jgi:uncharacterized protein